MTVLTGDTKVLKKLHTLMDDFTKTGYRQVSDAASQAVLARVLAGFDKGIDPDGHPWEPSIRVEEKGGRTLRDRDFLYKSWKVRPDQAGFALFVSNKDARKSTKYAWVHNEGLRITVKRAKYMRFRLYRPDGKYVAMKAVTIPKRQFVPYSQIPQSWLSLMFNQINKTVGKPFGVTP